MTNKSIDQVTAGLDRPKNLSEKEWLCLEYYIQFGNQRQAGIRAGYAEKTASQQACRIINSKKGKAYINQRIQEQRQVIASTNEILQYLTKVMRGEIQEKDGKQIAIKDRTNAAVELMKRVVDTTLNEDTGVQIIDDIPLETEM